MLSPKIQQALEWEEKRKKLLAQGKLKAVRQTYRDQKVFLPDENTGPFWDEKFGSNDAVFPMEQWRNQLVVDLLDCSQSILNLGVGRGQLESLLVQKCATPQYLGTDITSETITRLRQRFPTLEFKKGNLLALSAKKHQFDQILLLEVLEHIRPNQTFAVLEKVWSLLKPGGLFFLSVPVNEGLEDLLPTNPNSHMRLYSPDLLRFEVEQMGFQVERVYQASAFPTQFRWKNLINSWLRLRQPNNLVFICRRPIR